MKTGDHQGCVYQNNDLCGLMRGECLSIGSGFSVHELPELNWPE